MRNLFTLVLGVLFAGNLMAGEPGKPVTRETAPESAKWRLTDIYPTMDAWNADLATAQATLKELVAMKGTLGASSSNLLRHLQLSDEFGKLGTKLYCYAYLGAHSIHAILLLMNSSSVFRCS